MTVNSGYWTDFADGAVVFPLGIAIALVLAAFRQRQAAIAWTIAIGCVWTTMLALKLGGYTLAALIPISPLTDVDLVTPSGHVASAAAVYGGLIGLVLWRPGTLMWRTVAAALVVAVGIGATRVQLGVHSLSEAIIGAMVGVAGAAWLASTAGVVVDRRARLPLVAVAGLIVVVLHGEHFSWEQDIRRLAQHAIESWRASS